METPIKPKTPPLKGSWHPVSRSEPAFKGQPPSDHLDDNEKNADYEEDYDDGEDKYEEDMEWTDAELELMCRRLADSKQKKEVVVTDWSIRQSKDPMTKSASTNRYEDQGKKTRIQV